ncbi:MAG: glucose-6-phosphate dehydrogenase [Rhabdochlamydiaceae bacterium]|nr:glucose-6-phosphate dehydrogenase [Rhabdochlamydiaceae bacterium]
MNPLREETQSRFTEPCIVVIFGATGDLTSRKLIPALYNILKAGQLPSQFACVGFARRTKTDGEFRKEMHEAVQKFSRTKPIDEHLWKHFEDHLYYHISEFHDDEGYVKLKQKLEELDHRLGTKGNRIFYFATPSSYFPLIAEKLKKANLIYPELDTGPWSRVIIEKPFGRDLSSAEDLQKELMKHLGENQIFRIDHWLGKETVQNLLVFRFANSIFESLWNNRYIDHIQITVAEDLGIETRGKFWEETGLIRDIVQNHVMQLVSLVGMEPPVSLDANAIRDEKVKVLQAIRPIEQKDVVLAQYTAGLVGGEDVIGYLQEKDVSPTSQVETYAALRLHIDNWRWSGVPFYLRSGKRLPKRSTEIAITFKDPPGVLFQQGHRKNDPNVFVIQIQPDEGISLKINCKVPGPASPIQPVKMDFKYGSYFGTTPPEAYERLICDAILGDSTLFARQDEVLLSWKLLSPVLKGKPSTYPAGSWGPVEAEKLLEQDGRHWRLI